MICWTNLEVREHVGVISNEEGVGHVGQFLGVLFSYIDRRRLLISDYVVHERSTTGSGVTEPHRLFDAQKRLLELSSKLQPTNTG